MSNRKYNSREEEIRAELSLEEVINIIRTKYKFAEYDPDRPNFDAWDQLLACEAVAESTPVNQEYERETSGNSSVNGMISDSCKRNVIFELTQSRHNVITELSKCNYRTHPIKIAQLLKELFKDWESKDGHWLYIAQNWTPRAINRTINRLTELHISGQKTINNPPGYFTLLVKHRKRRKS